MQALSTLTANVRIEFLRGCDIGIATCIVPPEPLGRATPIQCRGVVRPEPDRLVVVRDGAVYVVLGLIGAATAVVSKREARIVSDRLVVVNNGSIVIALGLVRDAAVADGKYIF